MTNPLTTPSGVEQSIPIPRNADGSPMSKAQARIIRARQVQKQILAGQSGAQAELESDEATYSTNDVSTKVSVAEVPTDYKPAGVTADGREGPKLAGAGELSLEEAERRLAEVDAAHEAELAEKPVEGATGTPISVPVPTHAGEYVNGEGELAETPAEPQEAAETVKPANPRQPEKKTPAQKRAETLAAKKAAAAEKGEA